MRALARRAHRELVHVGLTQNHAAGALELLHDVSVIGRDEVVQNFRPARGKPALRAEDILQCNRNASQGLHVAMCNAHIGRVRLRERYLRVERNERVQLGVVAPGTVEKRLRQLDAGDLFIGQRARELANTGIDHAEIPARGLFDYFWDQVESRVHQRRNCLEVFASVAFGDAVLAQAQADVLRVRHRLHAMRIDRLQFFDERKHALQLRQDFLDLLFAQFETSELSDPCNIANTQGHGRICR
jgi:hypothetical protein